MTIDKQNGNVRYNDEEHLYWDDDGKYISVTTLIGKYANAFDKDFWSAYKALERIMTSEQFRMEKSKLLQTRVVDIDNILNIYDLKLLDFNKAQQDILDEWQRQNEESCKRGTAIHAQLENMYVKKSNTDLKKYGLGGTFLVNTNKSLEMNNQTLLEIDKGVFPEYLVSRKSEDGKFKLAGQIDLLIKDGNNIWVRDYKTNRKIDQKSYFDPVTKKNQMMLAPLSNIMDSNYWHYALQLSTYAWMLQKINPEFKIQGLTLEHHDHFDNIVEYEVPYLKSDVERMCKDYKLKLILKERADRRKPIEF